MIFGIGIDIIEIGRFEQALKRWGERLCQKIFTDQEILFCQRKREPARHFALRFAAKEAFLKALGTGMFQGVIWKDIEILNDPSGRPYLKLGGRAEKICDDRGITNMFVSISHEHYYGVAQVVLEV